MQERDHEFLLRVGIVPALRRLVSLRKASDPFSQLVPSPWAADWMAWPAEYVANALQTGSLTKRDLVIHMQNAPRDKVPEEWLASHGLTGRSNVEIVMSHTVQSLAALYREMASSFGAAFAADATPRDAAVRIQAFCRGVLARRTLTRQQSGGVDEGRAVATPAAPTAGPLSLPLRALDVRAPDDNDTRGCALALLRLLTAIGFGCRRRGPAVGDGKADVAAADATAAGKPPAAAPTTALADAIGGGDDAADATLERSLTGPFTKSLQVCALRYCVLLSLVSLCVRFAM
jgi:hypothetical protein